MPPEWAPQSATWLSWPVADPRHWGGNKASVISEKFAEIAAHISKFQKVRINAPKSAIGTITTLCNRAHADLSHIEIYDHPNNDVWCRDHGPIFLKNKTTEEIALVDFEFNAWGGKFSPWDLDDRIPTKIAESLQIQHFEGGMILEGGAIEINGERQLLTTEAVLLNKNRNPHLTKDQIEQKLMANLGIDEILWLENGLEGDDTDGHIDDLARFTNSHTIVTCVEPDKASPNHKTLSQNLKRLENFLTKGGRPFDIVPIHLPQACEVPGWRLPILPASYVNFLLINGAVLVPTFRQPANDEKALGIISEHFPNREIIPVDCLDLVEEGGALHCISQQQPS